MSFIEVENGKSYYCEVAIDRPSMSAEGLQDARETVFVGGSFSIGDGAIRLRLVRFDDYFDVREGERLEARTESNWIASLFDIVPTGTGQVGFGKKAAYNASVLVNTAVIGWDAWSNEDRVRRTQFRVPSADLLLRHRPTYESLANNPMGQAADWTAFNAPISVGRVRVYYSAYSNMDSEYPRDVWPVVEIEFDESITLSALHKQTTAMLGFLSAAASINLSAREQVVSRLSHAELLDQLGCSMYPSEYSIYYYENYRRRPEQTIAARPYTAFGLLHDDNERSAFIACLQSWFDRYTEWEGAASAMMVAFALRHETSSERLLNATKWIEVTPSTKAQPTISNRHVRWLSDLLNRNAVKLGYVSIKDRLSGCLRQIANEQNSRRFTRIAADLKAFYGDDVVGDHLAEWVTEAFRFRGKAAHHPVIAQTDAEYMRLAMATYAAECFAYLMLLRALPISTEGKTRVASAPLVERYRDSVKGKKPPNIK